MEMLHTCIFIFTVLVTRDVLAGTVHLLPEFAHVVENDSVGLNCSFNGSKSQFVKWTNIKATNIAAYTMFNNSDCLATGFLATPSYEVRCRNDWAFVKIKNAYRNQSGHLWQCSILGQSSQESNQVRLYVIVPVASVQMIFYAEYVEENAVTEFTCDTSTSRPTPFVFWFLISPDQKTSINISNQSVQVPPAGHTENLTKVRSDLSYSFNRTYGGWNIYCLATNVPGENGITAQKKLIIFYPPEGPLSIRGLNNGSTYRIVETENVQLSCIVTGGNPTPNITWSCLNGNVSRRKENKETVISNITWKSLRNQNNKTCVCRAKHFFGTAHVFVVIEVLYPPDRPNIKRDMELVTNEIQIIQNNSFTLTCESNGNPEPEYMWINKTKGPILNITSFQKQDTGKYICQVNNTMIGSDGENHSGHNNTSITAHVLFPPTLPSFLYNDNNISTFISGYAISVIKGDHFRLFCQSTGRPRPAFRWEDNTEGTYSVVEARVSVNRTCIATNLMMETVGESRPGTASAGLFIEVLYPPDTPVFKIGNTTVGNQISIIQNNSKSVTCMTDSKPESNYMWVGNSVSAETTQTLNITSDAAKYTCTVNNTMVRSYGWKRNGFNSSSIAVKTLFPPTLPSFTYIDHSTSDSISGHSVEVIKGDMFTIVCYSSGNPNPDYSWEDGTSGNSAVISASQSVNKTCTATNTMIETVGESRDGNNSAVLSISVHYPPMMLGIYLHHSTGYMTVANTLKVLEGDSFSLSCESDGRPTPDYTWYLNNSVSSFKHIIEKVNISRHERGTYTCHAYNTMIRTFGKEEKGSSNIRTDVDILYPAEVDSLNDLIVIEGNSINITCPVIPGNPPLTSVKWLPGGDLRDRDSRILYIANVSRNDEGIYYCSVNSTMEPSHGLKSRKENSGHFQISVVYKAIVTQFFVGEQIEQTATINESDDVTFWCSLDSKPSSVASLSHNGNIFYGSHSNILTNTKRNMQCNGFGTYMCSGMNDYNNGTPSVKTLTIYVNCSPRHSPDVSLIEKVAGARDTEATLSFTALAYPVPGPSGFTWYFLNGSDMILLENSSNLIISSSTLLSKLTIRNVKESDYGEYLLRIENTINVFEQRYSLEPHASTPRPLETSDSSNTGAFVGVGFVSVVTTLIIVGIVYIIYRHNRGRQKHEHTVEYKNYADIRRSSNNDESSVTYESLEGSQKEKNPYSQLPASHESLDDVTRERSSYMTLQGSKRKRDTPDYINIRI